MRKLIVVAGVVCLLTVSIIFGHRLVANPVPSPAPGAPQVAPAQSAGPMLSWSLPQLAQTMFPGTSSTVVVSFRSDQNLTDAVVDITPSLNGIVAANPTSFAAITAGQSNQITLTLTAPPEFTKRSFGGTIHLRNGSGPPKTYDQPLAVNLQTDWNTASPDSLFTINIPLGWNISEIPSSGVHTFTVSTPEGVRAGWLYVYTLQQWAAVEQGDVSPVLLIQAGSLTYAYGVSESLGYGNEAAEFTTAISTFQVR